MRQLKKIPLKKPDKMGTDERFGYRPCCDVIAKSNEDA